MFRDKGGDDIKVSLRGNYDGHREVNTPISLLACAEEGIDPAQLVRPQVEDPYATLKRSNVEHYQDEDGPAAGGSGDVGDNRTPNATPSKRYEPRPPTLTAEKEKLRKEHAERQRKRLLGVAKSRHAQLLEKGTKNPTLLQRTLSKMKGTPRPATSQEENASELGGEGAAGTTTSLPMLPLAHRGGNQSQLDEGDIEVAKAYLVLAQAAEKRGRMREKLREKDQHTQEFKCKAAAEREKKSEEAAKRAEEQRIRTLNNYQANQKTRVMKSMKKIEEKDSKIETAKASVKKSRPPPDPNRGAKEREAALKANEERLAKLAQKIERANNAAASKKEAQERERELQAIQSELVADAQYEQNQRAKRILEHKKEELNTRIEIAAERRRQLDADRADLLHQRMLRRERVARQKQLVADYINDHEGATHIDPPDWLQAAVDETKKRLAGGGMSATTGGGGGGASTSRAPRPPQRSPSGRQTATTPRGTKSAGADSEDMGSTRGGGNKSKFVSAERFTIFTADQPAQRCYPKWSYQTD